MKRSIEKLRYEYGNATLLEENLHLNPLKQFNAWLNEAIAAQVFETNAMVLATVSMVNRPSTRTVLLKAMNKEGLIFYTSYLSRKGEHLRLNPYASATFWWKEIYRQVNFEGKVKKLSRAKTLAYFYKRPRGAQLAALASTQSAPLGSREGLVEAFNRLQTQYRGIQIPCPKEWGGYTLIPDRIEFWQGRKNRLHDRFLYVKEGSDWIISRLSP